MPKDDRSWLFLGGTAILVRTPLLGDVPFVESCQLVFALLVPFASSLQVVLVVKSTADRAPARQSLGDVLPLHAISPQLDDEGVFLGRPLALFLRR